MKICQKCGIKFKGQWNTNLCDICRKEYKICTSCNQIFKINEFRRKKDYYCKECFKKFHRNKEYSKNKYWNNIKEAKKERKKWRDDHRKKVIELIEFVKNNPCVDCGKQFEPHLMDFHHREPNKKEFKIAEANESQLNKIQEEINKCDLLCVMCHRERHENNEVKYERKSKNKYTIKAHRYRDNKRIIIKNAKCVPCASCGVQYPYYQMDFHHKNDKKFNLSQSIKVASIKKIKSEIEKCDVLCCICHRNYHTQERSGQ